MIPKFRAWDKMLNKMTYSVVISKDWALRQVPIDILNMFDNLSDRYILMQSTGLKDKNGVEIFEGDILENITQISYLGEKYKVVKNEKYANFILLDNKGLASNIPIFESETSYEVISNIYENSELLYDKEMKKYYLRHKYLSDFDNEEYVYLNWDWEYERMFLDSLEGNEDYITQFTNDLIEMLVQNHGLNLIDWIKVEVE